MKNKSIIIIIAMLMLGGSVVAQRAKRPVAEEPAPPPAVRETKTEKVDSNLLLDFSQFNWKENKPEKSEAPKTDSNKAKTNSDYDLSKADHLLDFSNFNWGSSTGTATKTVTIGSQIWALKNLDVSSFKNGDPIPEAKTEEEWLNAGKTAKPAWCYYNNEAANGEKYGKLYNWYAVNDPRGLAPAGWHIPSKDEWGKLSHFLGGYGEGEKLRSATGWKEGVKNYFNSKSTNESGFTALPGQSRSDRAFFTKVAYAKAPDQDWGYWWSSTEFKTGSPASGWYPSTEVSKGWAYGLGSNSDLVLDSYQNCGLSVRCIKN